MYYDWELKNKNYVTKKMKLFGISNNVLLLLKNNKIFSNTKSNTFIFNNKNKHKIILCTFPS